MGLAMCFVYLELGGVLLSESKGDASSPGANGVTSMDEDGMDRSLE